MDEDDALIGGRFRIAGLLGSGGTASVYEAIDRDGTVVALKVLHPHLSTDAVQREAFVREARIVAGVADVSLCGLVGWGMPQDGAAGATWTAWERVPGVSLAEAIRDRGRLDPLVAAAVVSGVLGALAALHRAGLVHRDVSPSNVVVDLDDRGRLRRVCLIDFGLVGPIGSSTRGGDVLRSSAGDGVVGNAAYASPEQLRGEGVGPAGDVYQAGALLYFALVGAPPFPRESTAATVDAHLHAPPPTASVAAFGVPVGLDRVVVRAMIKDPSGRFASASDFRVALDLGGVRAVVDAPTRRLPSPAPVRADPLLPLVLAGPDATDRGAAEPDRAPSPWLWVLAAAAVVAVITVVVAVVRPASPPAAVAPAASTTSSAPTASVSPSAAPAPAPTARLVSVPDVLGLPRADAEAAIGAAGLTVAGVEESDAPDAPGTVLAVAPAPGAAAVTGAGVTLTVASGFSAVPDVVGLSEQAAIDGVTGAGFVPVVQREQRPGVAGFVVSVSPAVSDRQRRGGSVILTVSVPVPAPEVTPTAPVTATPTPGLTP